MREGLWTVDEMVLALDAYLRIRDGAPRKPTIEALARELDRPATAASAAVDANGSADPALGRGPALIPTAELIATGLMGRPDEVRRLAENIRALWDHLRA